MFNKRRTIPSKRVRKVVIGSTDIRYRDSVEVTRASGMKKAMKELRTEKRKEFKKLPKLLKLRRTTNAQQSRLSTEWIKSKTGQSRAASSVLSVCSHTTSVLC